MPAVFQLDGFDAFLKAIDGFAKTAERDVLHQVKLYAYTITYALVMDTPQYSGAAASAWRVGVGAPDLVTEKPNFEAPEGQPYSMRNRNSSAVDEAMVLCGMEIGAFTLQAGDMYIANGLPYAQWFKAGLSGPGQVLRTVNMPQRGVHDAVISSLTMPSVLRF